MIVLNLFPEIGKGSSINYSTNVKIDFSLKAGKIVESNDDKYLVFLEKTELNRF